MTPNEILIEAVRAALDGVPFEVYQQRDEVTLSVPRGRIVEALQKLRDHETTRMNQLMDVCGVDTPDHAQRFAIVYQLLSLKHNWRLTLFIETDEVTAVPSVVAVYPSAGWFEREVYDLFGVMFAGHPDLRRILTDYGFEGHPLRRDFPLVGFTEMRYDDTQRRVIAEPVSLQQDYRAFDACSPWQGMEDVQKRGGNA